MDAPRTSPPTTSGDIERHWPLVRDILSFAVGVYVVITQLGEEAKDPATLAFGAALMGVPAMLGAKRNGKAG